MTANTNPELFNTSDGLVVRSVKRNVVGWREQLRLQTTPDGGRHNDESDHPRKTVPCVKPSDREGATAEASKCTWNVAVAILCRMQVGAAMFASESVLCDVSHLCTPRTAKSDKYLMAGTAVQQMEVVGQTIIVGTCLHHQFSTH